MMEHRLFEVTGAHILIDGQYGSTGKGALASWLASCAAQSRAVSDFAGAISSSGPNSGHTSYYKGRKIVLKQLPTFGVHAHLWGYTMPCYLSAGAVIDINVLLKEADEFPQIPIFVHPQAAVVLPEDRDVEMQGSIAAVAGTRSGTGAAIARKVMRDPSAVWKFYEDSADFKRANISTMHHNLKPFYYAYFMEVAQGFSLGIHSDFYPKVTSRECTVMQAIADARIPPRAVSKTYMCMRTFPIRVGNVDGFSSGEWYDDQEEMTWEQIGVEPELTTVTQRIRRVATFSMDQFEDALRANDPDWVAFNFLNYLTEEEQRYFIGSIKDTNNGRVSRPFGIIGGRGKNSIDWERII